MWATAEPGPAFSGHGLHPALAGQVLTVSELTQRVRARLAGDPRLQQVAVAGELSNVKRHSGSGHLYFYLKDAHSRLACVMWRSQAEQLDFEPRDGTQVVATGYVDVYPVQGVYQLYAHTLYPVGLGLFYARLQKLAARLSAEGLLEPARKRLVPRWPRAIGVVTSPDGAALRDIVAVARRRSPRIPLYVSPTRVQGDGASQSVIRALERLYRWPSIDVIIVARGGGALDELWTFNDEGIVRAVARSPVPVVSAVGHETDVTLVDLVADQRAPTPSAAAELVTPDEAAWRQKVESLRQRLARGAAASLERLRERLARLGGHWTLERPERWVGMYRQRVDEQVVRLRAGLQERLAAPRLQLARLSSRLSAGNPLALLERGYAWVADEQTGAVLRRAARARVDQRLRLQLWDGALGCRVERVELGAPAGARIEPGGAGGGG